MTDNSETPAEKPVAPADSTSQEKPAAASSGRVLNAVEARVLGCLIEKQVTTPDLPADVELADTRLQPEIEPRPGAGVGGTCRDPGA